MGYLPMGYPPVDSLLPFHGTLSYGVLSLSYRTSHTARFEAPGAYGQFGHTLVATVAVS